MNDLKAMWAARRSVQKELEAQFPSGCLYVQPIESKERNQAGGLPVEVTCEQGARLIHTGTHRIAMDSEIADYHEQAQRNLRAVQATANRNEGRVVLTLAVDAPRAGRKPKD